jgi:hypothetical protein
MYSYSPEFHRKTRQKYKKYQNFHFILISYRFLSKFYADFNEMRLEKTKSKNRIHIKINNIFSNFLFYKMK